MRVVVGQVVLGGVARGQAMLGLDVPVHIDREAARDAARRELSKPIYREAEPSLPSRILRWAVEHFGQLIDRISEATPGGWYGVAILLAATGLVGYLISRRLGPVSGTVTSSGEEPLFGTSQQSAGEHRAAADAAAARGDWPSAVRERFRAVIRTLEERGLVDDRPGRTADEAAAAGGAMLAGSAADLHAAAQLFDAVVYGGRSATAHHDHRLRDLERVVRTARPLARAGRGSVDSNAAGNVTVHDGTVDGGAVGSGAVGSGAAGTGLQI